MVGERILNREPIWRKAEDKIDDTAHRARHRVLDEPLNRRVPRLGQRNIGEGIGVGLVEAGIAKILEETLGIPFGSDTEIVDSNPTDGGMIYTVNVDAPLENMAKARGFLEGTTGFTSVLTDRYDVQNVEILKTRVLRDTYQVEVLVED